MSSHHSEDVSLVGLHPEPQNLLTSQRECRSLGGDMGLRQRQSRADEKASEPTPQEPGSGPLCTFPSLDGRSQKLSTAELLSFRSEPSLEGNWCR